MKVISLDQAKNQLAAVCNDVLQGEVVRLQAEDGREIELTPVGKLPERIEFTEEELRAGYEDADWIRFENNCAKASS